MSAHADPVVASRLRRPGRRSRHETTVADAVENRRNCPVQRSGQIYVPPLDGRVQPLGELLDLVVEELEGLYRSELEDFLLHFPERFVAEGLSLSVHVLELQEELKLRVHPQTPLSSSSAMNSSGVSICVRRSGTSGSLPN